MSASLSATPLVVEGVEVRYGRTVALRDASLRVERGTVFALLGRNGAGKTSLVRCLLGHRRAARGRALLFGEDCWRRRAALLARVGVVPERSDAPPRMTAWRLGSFFARLYPSWDAAAYAARLARFEIPAGVPFGRLSKGQRSQVNLGLAMASRPDLLVLDDPTLGLDAVARRAIYDELIDELAERRTTVFLTSHDLDGIEGLADRVGFLRQGRVVVDEPLEELKRRFRRIRVRGAEVAPPWLEPMRPLAVSVKTWGVEAIVGGYRAGAAELPAETATVEALSLEEIFVSLVGETPEGGAA